MPDIFVEENNQKKIETKPSIKIAQIERFDEEKPIYPFTAYAEFPSGVTFETEDPDEKILLFLKKHFITNVPWIVTTIILVFIPPLLTLVFQKVESPFVIPTRLITVFTLLYYLAVFAYAFTSFLTWFYNILLITQKRIVDIDFSDIVFHDVAETKLSLVEDVNYTQSGFLRTFFNYGDFFAQTAGGKENIEGLAVPNPRKAVRIVGDLIGKGNQGGD